LHNFIVPGFNTIKFPCDIGVAFRIYTDFDSLKIPKQEDFDKGYPYISHRFAFDVCLAWTICKI
jgi:hypothetical protein